MDKARMWLEKREGVQKQKGKNDFQNQEKNAR